MYRRCVLCGWGRKECLESVKFFCIPSGAGKQKAEWMKVLAEHRANGFKKVDSVCSIHFKSNKPSPDPTHVDFVPNLYLNRQTLPDSLRKACLRHFSTESPEVAEKREARLKKLNNRAKILKEKQDEPPDAWLIRKRERAEQRKQNRGTEYNPETIRWKASSPVPVVRNFILPETKVEEMESIYDDEEHAEQEEIVVDDAQFEPGEEVAVDPDVELYEEDPIIEVSHEEEVIAEEEPEPTPMLSYVRPDIGRLASVRRVVPHRQYFITQPQPRRTAYGSQRYQMEPQFIQRPRY